MRKPEKYSDDYFKDLLTDLEMREAPENLKTKIMQDVRSYSHKKQNISAYLQIAMIALGTALILLPFSFAPIINFVEVQIFPLLKPFTQISGNYYYVIMVVFTSAILILAERLINLFIRVKTNKSLT